MYVMRTYFSLSYKLAHSTPKSLPYALWALLIKTEGRWGFLSEILSTRYRQNKTTVWICIDGGGRYGLSRLLFTNGVYVRSHNPFSSEKAPDQ